MQYKKNQRMFLFLSIEAVMFLFFFSTEARHVLSMFLIFKKFEPQRSYKHGSYSRKSVYYLKLFSKPIKLYKIFFFFFEIFQRLVHDHVGEKEKRQHD